jgi:hypothetical protein
MTSQLSIVETTNTFSNETIHIMPDCVVHFHGHWNKVVPLMKPYIYLRILAMTLSSITVLAG